MLWPRLSQFEVGNHHKLISIHALYSLFTLFHFDDNFAAAAGCLERMAYSMTLNRINLECCIADNKIPDVNQALGMSEVTHNHGSAAVTWFG